MTAAAVRACPACGALAGADAFCGDCGTRLTTPPLRHPPSLAPLLHPSEGSRYALAVAAACIVALPTTLTALAAGLTTTIELGLGLLFIVGVIWATQQVLRARLLGRGLQVDAETMPALQAVIDDVRGTLGYAKRVDVYVVDKGRAPITVTGLCGTRILILEGALVDELLQPGVTPQLAFLLGRSFGALAARNTRVDLLVALLTATDGAKYVSLLLRPWFRATTYSGDQIGMTCCADLEAALRATARLLVGRELGATLAPADVLRQAALVRRRVLPRIAELFQSEPHITNRYVNLLCYARYHDPGCADAKRGRMGDAAVALFDEAWARSPHRSRLARATA